MIGVDGVSKNKVKVMIAGNTIELQGVESKEHMTRVAAFIQQKFTELNQVSIESVKGTIMQYMLTAINVADDYIKLKDQMDASKKEVEAYEQTLEDCLQENTLLKARIEELGLEIQQLRIQKQSEKPQIKQSPKTEKNVETKSGHKRGAHKNPSK